MASRPLTVAIVGATGAVGVALSTAADGATVRVLFNR